jgi:uncharacterized protein DUF4242
MTTMKALMALIPVLMLSSAFAADAPAQTTMKAKDSSEPAHRYIVERTFPQGALDGLSADTKAKVNETNSQFGVTWVTSYANESKTKTFCLYEGPNEAAIRKAAAANHLPVDKVTEVPVTLSPR